MNKTLFLLAATLLLANAISAQTISGTVLHGNGPAAVGKQVYATTDSASTGVFITGTAYTDASGHYTITLSDTPDIWNPVIVSVNACGQSYGDYAFFDVNEFSVELNIEICDSTVPPPPPPVYTDYIEGRLMLLNSAGDSVGHVTSAIVYVIDKTYDAGIGAYVLSLVDTIHAHAVTIGLYTGSAQFSKFYTAGILPDSGHVLLKGALDPSDTNYAIGLPSYYTLGTPSPWGPTYIGSLNWNDASIYTITGGQIIGILEGVNTGGPGFIGGSVLMGANKPSGVGDPLSNRLVLLTKADGTPVSYQTTDANGAFAFGNLAYGTYHIFGDAWGKDNPHLEVTISGTTPSVSNVRFDENSTSFTGSFSATGVANAINPQLAAIRVSPVPVGNELNIEGLIAVAGAKNITLTGMGGQVVYKASLKAGADISIPVTNLANGIYLLDVSTTQGNLRMMVTK